MLESFLAAMLLLFCSFKKSRNRQADQKSKVKDAYIFSTTLPCRLSCFVSKHPSDEPRIKCDPSFEFSNRDSFLNVCKMTIKMSFHHSCFWMNSDQLTEGSDYDGKGTRLPYEWTLPIRS